MKKSVILFVIMALLAGTGVISAYALTISPAKIELSGDPGQTIKGQFLLVNEQTDTKTLYTSVENFESQGETGTPTFVPGKDGLASWISVEPQFTLAKGEQKTIPFTVNVPSSAEAGGYFAAIFLTSTPPQNEEGGQVSIGAKIGVLILFTVPGNIKEGGGILNFATVNNQKFFASTPISFFYRFHNDGADRVLLDGDLTVRNMFGHTSFATKANPSVGSVLPQSTRRFQLNWGEGTTSPMGFFPALKHELSDFAFGMYTAHLGLAYGTGKSAASDYRFFIIPWHLLLIVLIILVILALIIPRLIRRYNRYVINKARETSS